MKSTRATRPGSSHPFATASRAVRLPALAAVILASLTAPVAAQDLATADAAFMQQHFPDAQRAYRSVLATGSASDRREAALALAVIDWMIDGDTARAMRDLHPFVSTAPALTMVSRARLDAHNASGARAAGRAAVTAARDAEERRDASVALADAALFPFEASCLDSTAPRPGASAAHAAGAARAQLRATVNAELGHLDASERLVRLAAISGDWESLALGWRSYYAVGRRVPGGPLVRAEAELDSMAHAAPARKASHAYAALVDSKLYQPAALIATCGALASPSPSAETREIAAYARFLRDATRATNAYYRTVALGHADTTAWQAKLDSLGKRLWPHFVWSGSRPAYDLRALELEAERRFDLVANMGNTGDVVDLHAGHRISTESRDVVQYGKRGHLTFSVLDGMISDGYQTWAWDGRAEHGGWASATEIIQVRDGYAEGPLKAWHALTDAAIIARDAKTLARDSASDIARARTTEIAYFPSVDERLRRDVRSGLLDSLRRSGLTGRDLELAFVRTYGDDVDESSIFVHEGRHAIDKILEIADSSAKNLEYQAKLSELAFAPLPKLALAGILGANTGDDTPHGIADARIMREMLAWMRHHGFSEGAADLPLPLQIPKLTDAQIREVSRSLDPLAKQ
ncbi:MAG TPA: hypothetical protein VGJ12_15910 [Gemmatimonadaceae bacterium]